MSSREGFTLVELIVAVVLLSIGILGLAGSRVLLTRQATIADLRSDRAAATANVVERLRVLPFDSIGQGADSIGPYQVTWTSQQFYSAKRVAVITRGPGFASAAQPGALPGLTGDQVDTVFYRIPRP